MTNESQEQLLDIILSEYKELRIELMYFLTEQRKHINMMISLVAGQMVLLLNTDKLNNEIIAYIYLFAVPFMIFILMVRTLEATSNILVVADYIHKGIKPQLKRLFKGETIFFEWEEHKGTTKRFSKKLLRFLEYTRWYIFGLGILSSNVLGYWFYSQVKDHSVVILIIATLFNILWTLISVIVSNKFSEIDGEALNCKVNLTREQCS